MLVTKCHLLTLRSKNNNILLVTSQNITYDLVVFLTFEKMKQGNSMEDRVIEFEPSMVGHIENRMWLQANFICNVSDLKQDFIWPPLLI